MRKFHWFSLLTVLALLLGTVTPLVAAPAVPHVTQVNVAGSFESEIGGSDWSNNDPLTNLTDTNSDGVWKFSATVPAGAYAYKMVEDADWGKAYPANDVPLAPAANGEVRWYYDQSDHYVADSVNQVIASVPGNYQSKIGCAGDWQADCLKSLLKGPETGGVYKFTTTAIPVGSYEAKVAMDEKWDVSYGQGGVLNGPNIPFTVSTAADPVTFTYDATTHVLTIQTTPPPPPPAGPQYAVIHYYRPGGDYDGWGLHLWGDAIDPTEGTSWGEPKMFSGQDDYGKYVAIKLRDPTKPVNFIIHKGGDKDTPADRSFNPSQIPENWLVQGDAANHGSRADALKKTVIHYHRADGDYTGWGLHLWGDGLDPTEVTQWGAPKLPTGTDDYGAYFEIKLADPSKPVNFIVHKGDAKDLDADRSYTPAEDYAIWLQSGDAKVYKQRGAAEGYALLHYRRTAGDYTGWGLHVWGDSAEPDVSWGNPLQPAGTDGYGIFWKVRLTANPARLNYLIHKGDTKDPGPDQAIDLRRKRLRNLAGAGSGDAVRLARDRARRTVRRPGGRSDQTASPMGQP